MGKVVAGCTVSLDGFIAKLDDTVDPIFDWYANGDTEVRMPNGQMVVKVSQPSAAHIRALFDSVGALVIGRRTFDITNGWNGSHPFDVPVFVVTHRPPPADWPSDNTTFTFVTEGVEKAVELAKHAAGDKDVGVGMSTITQQCLRAGLLDEIGIDLMPVLLGKGVRLFDNLDIEPIVMERTQVIEGNGVTHLRFRLRH